MHCFLPCSQPLPLPGFPRQVSLLLSSIVSQSQPQLQLHQGQLHFFLERNLYFSHTHFKVYMPSPEVKENIIYLQSPESTNVGWKLENHHRKLLLMNVKTGKKQNEHSNRVRYSLGTEWEGKRTLHCDIYFF